MTPSQINNSVRTSAISAAETPAPSTEPQAVSKLAAKVAHELNNPLDAVLRFVSLAQRKAKVGDFQDIERYLADAQFGLQRMAEILRELMDIGRKTQHVLDQKTGIPLTELLALATRTAAAAAEQKSLSIVTRNQLTPELAPRYDVRLAQVLANLLKNAVEASPDHASITIELSTASQRLHLAITDAGPGIDPALFPQLFTPFVTTKSHGAGHGLGLAISREIVISLGGALTLENRPTTDTLTQSGCIARVELPLANL